MKKSEYRKDYYQKHKIREKESAQKRRLEYPEYMVNWRNKHRERVRELNRISAKKCRNELKNEIFNLLGNKCSNPNCLVIGGCTDVRCLQIDHVYGNGLKEQKKFYNTFQYYKLVLRKIQSGSKDYQLLCANCNWIKRCENCEFIEQPIIIKGENK